MTDRLATCRAADCRAPKKMTRARCKSPDCNREILWRANITTGKRLPLDATPIESDARFVSARRHHYRLLDAETCRPATVDEWNDHTVPLFISHFRTCKRVDLWSGRRAS